MRVLWKCKFTMIVGGTGKLGGLVNSADWHSKLAFPQNSYIAFPLKNSISQTFLPKLPQVNIVLLNKANTSTNFIRRANIKDYSVTYERKS